MDEKFKEPTRAWRRRQKERKVQQAYRRGLESNWRRKEPEEYWFLDPDNEDDMMDIWCMDDELRAPYNSKIWAVYIIGKGVINPPTEINLGHGHEPWTPRLPYLTDEEIHEDILMEAKKKADNQADCSCIHCGNPRKNGWNRGCGTVKDHLEYEDAIGQLEDENLHIEKKRFRKRFSKGRW